MSEYNKVPFITRQQYEFIMSNSEEMAEKNNRPNATRLIAKDTARMKFKLINLFVEANKEIAPKWGDVVAIPHAFALRRFENHCGTYRKYREYFDDVEATYNITRETDSFYYNDKHGEKWGKSRFLCIVID